MGATSLPRKFASGDNVALGKQQLGIWVKSGGLYTNVTYKTVYGAILPDIQNLDPLQAEPINEREHYEMGFKLAQINDGVDWSTTLEVEGNSRHTPAWLIGQQLNTNPVLEFGKDFGAQGHLILYNVNSVDELVITNILLDVGVKLMQLPGGANSENNMQIELYAKDGRSISVHNGHPISFEFFWDDATDPNAAAPDGILTTFTLGDGNRSYGTPAPPTSLIKANPDVPGTLAEYFLWLRLDGVTVSDGDATFDEPTKTITFTTAPAAGAFLEMGYIVDKSGVGPLGQPAHLHAGSNFLTSPKVFMIA